MKTLTLLLVVTMLLAAAARGSPIGADPTGDARGSFGALSVVGDATTGEDCYDLPPPLFFGCIPLLALTGTGDATGGFLAASGTGGASDSTVAVSGTGRANGQFLSVCVSDPLACQRISGAATLPTGAAAGPDADGDGVPAHVDVQRSRVALDANTQTFTVTGEPPQRFTLDARDDDPDHPVDGEPPTSVRVVVPRGAVLGLDRDGDGLPSDVTLYHYAATVGTNGTLRVGDGGTFTARIDTNDSDPRRPIPKPSMPKSVTVTIPTSVAPGPDEDGDGVPAYVEVQATRAVITLDPLGIELSSRPPARDPVDPDDHAREAHVSPDGDARGSVLAVSGTGDASSCEPRVTCVAISVAGDADGYYAASGTGKATGCTSTHFLCAAASGTGDASSTDFAASGLGAANGGDAGASGAGPASGTLAASGANACNGTRCAAASEGDADADHVAASTGGTSRGLVAASVAGDAEGELLAVSVFGGASGPFAASGCDAGACLP